MEPIKIFYCYAREDEKLRQELEKHLSGLRRSGKVVTWHDQNIAPGSNWAQEIDEQLNTADIFLLLISQSFLTSDYCYNIEMRKALERHKAGEARVIPILLRPVPNEQPMLSGLSVLPVTGSPVTEWHNRDDAFLKVCEGILKVVTEIKSAEALRSGDKRSYQMQDFGLGEQKGAIVVYANKTLHGRTVDLYEGSHSDGKLHSSTNIIERKFHGYNRFLAIFPSLNPDDYTAFIDWKYYARVTVSANHVVEIDWKENSSLSKIRVASSNEDTTLETNL